MRPFYRTAEPRAYALAKGLNEGARKTPFALFTVGSLKPFKGFMALSRSSNSGARFRQARVTAKIDRSGVPH
jgi:hypothetical protein